MEINKIPEPDRIGRHERKIDLFVTLYSDIYDSGQIPNDCLERTFILRKNKEKILRILRKCEEEIERDQFAFRSGMGTREAVLFVNVLC